MPHKPGQKEESRARILAGAGRGFRRQGYSGLGVDGLAKEAGVTSGAFYVHFPSKADAFKAAVVQGLRDLRAGVDYVRAAAGRAWQFAFVEFYLTQRRTCDIEESCAAQSLSGDVERADDETRAAYTRELRQIFETMSSPGNDAERAQAIALLSLVVGGVTLARATNDAALSDEIAAAIRAAARRLIDPELGAARAPDRGGIDGGASRPDL